MLAQKIESLWYAERPNLELVRNEETNHRRITEVEKRRAIHKGILCITATYRSSVEATSGDYARHLNSLFPNYVKSTAHLGTSEFMPQNPSKRTYANTKSKPQIEKIVEGSGRWMPYAEVTTPTIYTLSEKISNKASALYSGIKNFFGKK